MDAQFALAGLYVEGVGVVDNPTEAARWYGEAARNGHVGAQVEYAIMLFNGRGVPKDEETAARWLQQAANADNPLAQTRLARLYAEGRGVDIDVEQAARWYQIAKLKGFADEFMESWMLRQSENTRVAAEAAAERWQASSLAAPRRAAAEAPEPVSSDMDPDLLPEEPPPPETTGTID
jgi:TPR repeat protein